MKRPGFVKMGILGAVLGFALILAACSPAASGVSPTVAPQPTAAVVQPTANQPAATAAAAATLAVAQKPDLGSFMADAAGRTLYVFLNDTGTTSTCYDQCAQAWPALLTSGAPVAGAGVAADLLGTTARSDGSTQVTFAGHPLYYFAADMQPGDVKGQGIKDVWFVIAPNGEVVGSKASAGAAATAAPTAAGSDNSNDTGYGYGNTSDATPQTSGSSAAGTVAVGQSSELGSFLTDAGGRTLYVFLKDTGATSACVDKCAQNWPALVVTGAPAAPAGIDAGLLGTMQRADGAMQVTFDGHPLYYYAKDQKPGDTNGQGVGDVWYVIGPDGKIVDKS
jgi:predicted lipoprotein with Yx(FWY)xxD motif